MNTIIFSINSDIGYSIADNWLDQGYKVIGTYRKYSSRLNKLKQRGAKLIACDLNSIKSINNATNKINKYYRYKWDVLLPCAATQSPVGLFKDNSFSKWRESVNLNFISQAHVIHNLLPYSKKKSTVINWAGGGVNNSVDRYSAYTVSKIALIKLTELLDSEIKNTKFVILGPGWVKTKIHKETLKSKKNAGRNYSKTKMMLNSNKCNDMENVINCVNRVIKENKKSIGGRNISVVFDSWNTKSLYKKLSKNKDSYKLRRFNNNL